MDPKIAIDTWYQEKNGGEKKEKKERGEKGIRPIGPNVKDFSLN